MKYLKMFNESFNESEIHAICKKYNITNYTINNGLVDVDGDVSLSYKGLTELPLNFGKITGSFYCHENQLATLEGCPTEVGGTFDCCDNNLSSLIGGPKVCDSFYCYNNQLTSLEGCPNIVGGDFKCNNNQLVTLEISGRFYCYNNQLTSLEGCPNIVGGDFKCNNNQLVTLEGCPKEISGRFYCYDNPVYAIYKLFPNHESFIDSLEYGYFRGENKINKIRFTQALQEINKECPENIKGYIWE